MYPYYTTEIKVKAWYNAAMRRLKELRRARGLTQRDLEDRSGVTHATICKLERTDTEPRISTIQKLADGLGVTPQELMREPVVS